MPAELTEDLYRMSMWQVDRWCQRHPNIDQDDVVSAVHERLTLALQNYDPANPKAKLTSWLARATWNGISSAIQHASRQKRQAIRLSDMVTEERPIDTIGAFSCKASAEAKAIVSDVFRKRYHKLTKRMRESFDRLLVLNYQVEDYETRSAYESDRQRAANAVQILSKEHKIKYSNNKHGVSVFCKHCRLEIPPESSKSLKIHLARKYCSLACVEAAKKNGKKAVVCENCGKTFVSEIQKGKIKRRTCSVKCTKELAVINNWIAKNASCWIKPCAVCGQYFGRGGVHNRRTFLRSQTCSVKCGIIYRNRSRDGRTNPALPGGVVTLYS